MLLIWKEILEILTNDARFFQEMRLIDYSLLILKIDWSHVE